MINLTPAQQQMLNILLLVFSASGPPFSMLLVHQGVDASTLNVIFTWLGAIGPTILSAVVAYLIHTPQAAVLTAGKVDGATVHVDTSPTTPASQAVIAAANSNDPETAGVQPAKRAA